MKSPVPTNHHSIVVVQTGDAALIEQVVSIVNVCYRGPGSWTGENDIVQGQRVSREGLQRDIAQDDVEILALLSEDDDVAPKGSVVGCVRTGRVTETVVGPLSGPPAAYLGMLAVRPQLQSRGLGRALTSEVERRAREDYKCERLVMDVLDCRADIMKWYVRLGFRETGDSIPAGPFMRDFGQTLLVDCSFVLLEKSLSDH